MTIFTTVNHILEYLSICPGATKENVGACFQMDPEIAERFLQVMVMDKKIERKILDRGKRDGKWGYYLREEES